MFRSSFLAAALALSAAPSLTSAAECITEAPMTVYESETLSPQNIDFDKENMLFVAHPGWYNDALVHYYKFRIFAPSTYEGVIAPGATATDVPIQKVYLVTTTGDFAGVVGSPIVEYHTADGNLYSDFMEVHFVQAPDGYAENTFKGVKDIESSGATVTSADILMNMPVVPTGSYLQHPKTKGTNRAPIDPVPVWYNCVQVWTYVFEVTDQSAAEYFAFTRTATDAVVATVRAGDHEDDGFEISVTPNMGSAANDQVNSIPIWHVNQYQRGVVAGTGGGPDPNGMRNVINLDRPDVGYSPLWQAFWATGLPIDYSANEASSNAAMSAANGFDFFTTPMFINCPNIGHVDKTVLNADMKEDFVTTINSNAESAWLLGTHQTLIFQPEMPITFLTADGTEIGATTTNMMGAYEYQLMTKDIPEGTTQIKVMFKEALIRTVDVVEGGVVANNDSSGAVSVSFGMMAAVLGVAVMVIL